MATTLIFIITLLTAVLSNAIIATAESHTVRFNNKCGHGTPQLVLGGKILSHGEDYTSKGPLSSAIAYLQTGHCLLNGENCAIVEMTLVNPTCPGCGSSVDLSLIPPHALNVVTGFSFYNGCDGSGDTCANPICSTAFFQSNDNRVQVACLKDNVDLLVTFCGEESPQPPLSSSHTASASRSSAPRSSVGAPHKSPQSTPIIPGIHPDIAIAETDSSSQSITSLTPSSTPSTMPSTPTTTGNDGHSTGVPPANTDSPSSTMSFTMSGPPQVTVIPSPSACRSRGNAQKRERDIGGNQLSARELYDARTRGIASYVNRAYYSRSLDDH